jgi:hypothetical protein
MRQVKMDDVVPAQPAQWDLLNLGTADKSPAQVLSTRGGFYLHANFTQTSCKVHTLFMYNSRYLYPQNTRNVL